MEHERGKQKNQSVYKMGKKQKKFSNFAKQENYFTLEEKLPQKPGRPDQVDLLINKLRTNYADTDVSALL